MVGIERTRRVHHLGQAARRWRRAVAFAQLGANRRLRHAGAAVQRDEHDPANRRQRPAKRHSLGGRHRVDADVLETAKPDQVIDGGTDGGHGKRLTQPRLDDLSHRRLRCRLSRDFDAHVDDDAADVLFSAGFRMHRPRQPDRDRDEGRAPPHQNVCLLRTSRA